MGAAFDFFTIGSDVTVKEVKQRYEEEVATGRHESGHSYSGNIGMTTGVIFPNGNVFESQEAAHEYVSEFADKWGPAVAVRFHARFEKQHFERTFGGKETYDFVSFTYDRENYSITRWAKVDYPSQEIWIADQVPESLKEEFREAVVRYRSLDQEYGLLSNSLNADIKRITDLSQGLDDEFYAKLKTTRIKMNSLKEMVREASKRVREIDLKLEKMLVRKEEIDNGIQWFVGGWCTF